MTEWDRIVVKGGRKVLEILSRVWYGNDNQGVSDSERAFMEPLFKEFPLGTDNFNVWLKQRTRQAFERRALDALQGKQSQQGEGQSDFTQRGQEQSDHARKGQEAGQLASRY